MKKIIFCFIGIIMMNLFSFCSNNTDLPWKDYPAIYKHIKDNIDSSGNLTETGDKLPDDSRKYKENEVRWVSGGVEGVFGHHGSGNHKLINKAASLTKNIAEKGKQKDKVELYKILIEDSLMDFIDPTLDKIVSYKIYPEPYLHNWAKWLAFESPDRGAVKYGIALLGLIGDKNDFNNLLTLGKHEEFTLYVAVAISNTFENPEQKLWELAKHVHGWGRIHIVEKLSTTNNVEIKRWFITEGYKNSIMYEYLAYICATAGNLKEELSQVQPSAQILQSAGDIIEALINGGPAQDINEYTDAAVVVELYLKHTLGKIQTIKQFLILNSIKSYLSNKEIKWDNLHTNGWSINLKDQLLSKVKHEMALPLWPTLVKEKQNTTDNIEFWEVDQVAILLGIDLWEIHWNRLNNKPHESSLWYNIMKNANNDRIDKIIEFASNKIDLNKIATGADNKMGLGKEYELHSCIDFIVQNLDKYPGKGLNLIMASLKSPVTRNRNMALKAINGWGQDYITPEIKTALFEAEKIEPDEDVKSRLNKLINGQPID